MSSRHNFLDADNSIMERNLRFVQNDLEDNLNQYFGSSGSRGNNPAISAPPRDYKVVQPKAENIDDFLETRHFLDERRKFLLQIGVPRNNAHLLARKTRFDVSYYRKERNEQLKAGLIQSKIDTRIYDIIKNGDYKRDNNNDRLEYKIERAAEREMANFEDERNFSGFKIEDNEPPAAPRKIEWNFERQIDEQHRRRSPSSSRNERREERNLKDNQFYRTNSPHRKMRRNDSPSENFNYTDDREIQNQSRRFIVSLPPRGIEWNNNNSRSSSRSPLRYLKSYEQKGEAGFDIHVSRKRSATPPISKRSYHTSRSKSPPRRGFMLDDKEFGRNANNSRFDKHVSRKRLATPPICLRSYQTSRSKSPPRRGFMLDDKEFGRNANNSRFDKHASRKRSATPPISIRSYQTSRSKSPPRKEFMLDDKEFERNANNSPSRYLNYMDERHSPFRNEDKTTNHRSFQLSRSRSPPRNLNYMQDNRWDESNVNNSPYGQDRLLQSSSQNEHKCKAEFGSFQPSDFPCALETKDFKSFGVISSSPPLNNSNNSKKIEDCKNTKNRKASSFNKMELEPSTSTLFDISELSKDCGNFNFTSKSSQISSNVNSGLKKQNPINQESISSNSSTLVARKAPLTNKHSKETEKDVGKPATFVPKSQTNTLFSRSAPYSLYSSSETQYPIHKDLKSSSFPTVVAINTTFTEKMPKESVNDCRNLNIHTQNEPATFVPKKAIDALSTSSLKKANKSSFTQDLNIVLEQNETPSSLKFPSLNKISSAKVESKGISPMKNCKYTWRNTASPIVNTSTQYTWKNTTSSSININSAQNQINPPLKKQPNILESLNMPISNDIQEPLRSDVKEKGFDILQDPTKVYKEKKPKSKKIKRIDVYKRKQANVTLIKLGFKKPSEGHLKANPKEYWTRWWSVYKYVENALIKVDPEDVYQEFHMPMEAQDPKFQVYKNFLLRSGIKKINRNLNVNEMKYPYVDSYRMFKYKKCFEDPKFQKALNPFELTKVQNALGRLENKRKLAFLHQSLISRWHSSMDIVKRASNGEMIKFTYARGLLRKSAFNYLVFESIQILKKLCQEDWPEFEDFFNNLKVEKFDSSGIDLLHNYSSKADSSDDDECIDDGEDDDEDDKKNIFLFH